MDTILILPEKSSLNKQALKQIDRLLAEHEFADDWDGAPATSGNLAEGTPTRLYSREGNPDTVELAMSVATTHNRAIAVHIDGSNGEETYEWNHPCYITWFDPKDGTRHEQPAGRYDPEPMLSWSEAVLASKRPDCAKNLTARIPTLQALGIIHTQ